MKNKPKLDLLASIQLKEITGSSALRMSKTQKIPIDADIRLFSDGSCYPSKALVQEFQLDYQNKDANLPEYGFDVFETSRWGMWPINEHFVMISQVSKHAKKVDLFGKCTYDKNGDPRVGVLEQGSSTFGKRLINMLENTYGEKLFENGEAFVDLLIVRDQPVSPVGNGIYNIPKLIVKGDKAGTYTYERRENITVFPLILGESFKEEVEQDAAVSEIASFGATAEEVREDSNHVADDSDAARALAEADDILGLGGVDSNN